MNHVKNIENYEFMWADENEVYFDLEPMMLNHGKNAIKKFGFGLKNALAYNLGFTTEFYIPKNELKRLSKEGLVFYKHEKKLKKLLVEIKISISKVKPIVVELLKNDFSRLSVDEFRKLWRKYGDVIIEIFTCYTMTQPSRIAGLEAELMEFFEQSGIPGYQHIISVLTKADCKIILSDEQNDLLKSFSETIKKEDYAINNQLASIKLYSVKKSHNTSKEKLIKKYHIPSNIVKIADIIGILGLARLEMRLNWTVLNYYHELFLDELKRRLKLSKEEIRSLNFNEIADALSGKHKIDRQKIRRRSKGAIMILKNGKISNIEGKETEDIMKIIKKTDINTKNLKGIVASKGSVQGRVLVLSYRDADNHSEKIKRMRNGDILVTEMTHPNIINACKKAGGIITDEGGMLSHAAIVSRELNIPCIIGTKNATQVLKDGDIVKMDTDSGEIKKIN
jgi:phosphoenolpyruvate synthase/pyruvate phosphate dikinase